MGLLPLFPNASALVRLIKVVPYLVLLSTKEFRIFGGRDIEDFGVLAQCNVPSSVAHFHRVSVHEVHRATPKEFFDDFWGIGFTRGRPSIFVLITLLHSEFLALFTRHILTPLLLVIFLYSGALLDFYLPTRVSD